MWQHRGYTGTGNVSGVLDSLQGRTAIVAGNAESVFEDLEAVLGTFSNDEPPALFAVNDIGMFLPFVDHWVTIHIQKFPSWLSVRRASEKNLPKIHSINYGVGINYAWVAVRPIFVLSGYFAMQLAYLMGADQIILCGCPGSPSRRFFDIKEREFGYGGGKSIVDPVVHGQIIEEMARLPEFKEKVRSMSGWTREFFRAGPF